MLDQLYETERDMGVKVSSIVLMGIGEPLDNYERVLKFLELLSSEDGTNMSLRHVSLSTCGVADKIFDLADKKLQLTLSVSLHAPNDEIRSRLMPVNRRYGIGQVVEAARDYSERTGRRVIFEYALIKGVNSEKRHAEELSRLLRGINCHVNLIPLNAVKERDLEGVSREEAYKFAGWLEELKISATVRREMGSDIEGACGQLRRSILQNQNTAK
jgi:23S rRNA (adenine2503-C2)-methyltransferase